jgi:argininosuccinate lyase
MDIEAGKFKYDTHIQHTHEGSIGNLETAAVRSQMDAVLRSFNFEAVHAAIASLIK